MIFVVYNPSIETVNFTKLMQADHDMLKVYYWESLLQKQEFKEAYYEV